MMQLPAPLARAFEDKVTITAGELCSLLPIDRKTLYRHISAGHIAWVQLGMGDRAVRRGFTLMAIMQFLEDRERIMSPPEPRRVRRRGPVPALDVPENDILVLHDRLRAEQAARQRKGHQPSAGELGIQALRGRLAALKGQSAAERKSKLQQ